MQAHGGSRVATQEAVHREGQQSEQAGADRPGRADKPEGGLDAVKDGVLLNQSERLKKLFRSREEENRALGGEAIGLARRPPKERERNMSGEQKKARQN